MNLETVKKRIKQEGVFWHLLKRIRNQIEVDKKGVVIIIIGAPGDGKSILADTIAYLVDSKFRVKDKKKLEELFKERISFTSGDFLKSITNVKRKKYSAFLFEDAGTMEGFSARRFMTTSNQAISSVLQTIRRNRFIIIMTVQTKKLVDVHIRDSNLSHYLIHAIKVNHDTKQNYFKIYKLSYDPITDKTYRIFLTYRNPHTKKMEKKRMFRANLRIPDYFLETYEKYADDKKREIEAKSANKVSSQETAEDKKSGKQTAKDIAIEILEIIKKDTLNGKLPKCLKYQSNYRKWCINQGYIMFNYEVGAGKALQIKGMVEIKIQDEDLDEKLDFLKERKFINE